MKQKSPQDLRTWIEIDARALRSNAEQFLRIMPPSTRLMAVIKSNAYGHGLSLAAKALSNLPLGNGVSKWKPRFQAILWFGVDSIVEALRLRCHGIKNPVLVLGYTLPARMREAAEKNIALTISNFDALRALAAIRRQRPPCHLKIDTGMHRQGFFPVDIPSMIRLLRRARMRPAGIYTHFANAKDPADRRYAEKQLSVFRGVISEMERAGFEGMVRHAAASGATILFPEAHLDMARVGMGLYGYPPSPESKSQIQKLGMALRPVLTWKTIVTELKEIPKNSLVGYDGIARVRRRTKIAVLPVGYWQGYDRGLSGIGEVIIRGRRARALGRISMDMTVVDATDIPGTCAGDEAVLIGATGKAAIFADEIAAKIDTTAYEFLTRINPLIRRIITNDQ